MNGLSFLLALCDTYPQLVANQAVSGVFRALAFTPGLVLIAAEFGASRRATAMSLYVASGFLAGTVLNLVGPLLVGPLGWRPLLALVSAASLVFVALYWRVGGPGPQPEPAATRPGLGDFAGLLRHPVVWLSSVVQFTRLAVVSSLRFWLPTYLVTDKGVSLTTAGVVVAVGNAVTLPANLVGGYVSDRRQQPSLVIGASLAVLAAGLGLLVAADDLALVVAAVAVLSLFMQAYSGALFEVPLRHLGTRSAGTLNGFGNFWANVGALVFAYVLGAGKDATGSFAPGWLAIGGLCVVALAATVVMARVRPPAPVAPS
ncbi:hypothetical protein Psuf_085840 [Phytohabitans suffuscus]|uniref:Major facilitator superfamily (MFS) profile domain-containing protein n=1 Tax=Phytohabitans suffuscus TaxID=624315 RepID=A0A6F8YZK8_9ACTN|nr:hypothetical protein Psuf_085840 [Phytohabitans suffuscus]